MAKTHRGAGLRSEVAGKGRGVCPECKRSGVKLLYEVGGENDKRMVCKECDKHLKKVAKAN